MRRSQITPAYRPPLPRAVCGCEVARTAATHGLVRRCPQHHAVYLAQEEQWRRATAYRRLTRHG